LYRKFAIALETIDTPGLFRQFQKSFGLGQAARDGEEKIARAAACDDYVPKL
jgi:hypothetical protein